MPISVSDRLAAVEQHPDWERLRQERPSLTRQRSQLGCGVIGGALFIGIGVFGVSLGVWDTGAPASWRLIGSIVVGGAMLIGAALVAYSLVLWRRFSAAPLLCVPAVVVDKRLDVSGGGQHSSSHTHYYVTLERRDGTRSELDVDGTLYGAMRQDDIGAAWIKGGALLDFRNLPPSEPQSAGEPRGDRRPTVVQSPPEPRTDASSQPALSIEVTGGPLEGQRVEVAPPSFQIGGAPGTDLQIPDDPYLSGQHAVFQVVDGQWMLVDEDSTNGTWIDGQMVERGRSHALRHGQSIRMGSSEFRVVLAAESQRRPPTELQ